MVKTLIAIAAVLASVVLLRACNDNVAEARIADLDGHIRLLIEAKRQAAGDDDAVQEFNNAILAAVIERSAIRRH